MEARGERFLRTPGNDATPRLPPRQQEDDTFILSARVLSVWNTAVLLSAG